VILYAHMKRLPFYRRPIFASKILEVGGGHNPYSGVTHAVDKFPRNNAQRAGDMALVQGAKFFEGDLESLPFKNEIFDFLYVSHVFEHVNHPEKAVSEINRVSRRGYMETPSPLREQIISLGHDSHGDFHTQFSWSDQNSNTVCTLKKEETTLEKFCSCSNGQVARALCDFQKKKRQNIEPILPGSSKTAQIYFKTPLKLRVFQSFDEACAAGFCAYTGVKKAKLWASWPLRLSAPRFGKLMRIFSEITS